MKYVLFNKNFGGTTFSDFFCPKISSMKFRIFLKINGKLIKLAKRQAKNSEVFSIFKVFSKHFQPDFCLPKFLVYNVYNILISHALVKKGLEGAPQK